MNKVSTNLFLLALIGSVCAAPSFAGESFRVVAAPEPATLALMAAGLGAIAVVRKVRNKQ